MHCKAFPCRKRRSQSWANSRSITSFSHVLTRSHYRLNTLPPVCIQMYTLSDKSSFASCRRVLKKNGEECWNNIGTPVWDGVAVQQVSILLDMDHLTILKLLKDRKKLWRQPNFDKMFHRPSLLTVSNVLLRFMKTIMHTCILLWPLLQDLSQYKNHVIMSLFLIWTHTNFLVCFSRQLLGLSCWEEHTYKICLQVRELYCSMCEQPDFISLFFIKGDDDIFKILLRYTCLSTAKTGPSICLSRCLYHSDKF